MRSIARLIPLLGLLFLPLSGCKEDVPAKPGRMLQFTSDFPEGVTWQVVATYEATLDKSRCKVLSMSDGKWKPGKKKEWVELLKPTDTAWLRLEIPTPNDCGWALYSASFQEEGTRWLSAQNINFLTARSAYYSQYKMAPDSFTFVCPYNPVNKFEVCDESSGSSEREFQLPPDSLVQFHIRLELPTGFK